MIRAFKKLLMASRQKADRYLLAVERTLDVFCPPSAGVVPTFGVRSTRIDRSSLSHYRRMIDLEQCKSSYISQRVRISVGLMKLTSFKK